MYSAYPKRFGFIDILQIAEQIKGRTSMCHRVLCYGDSNTHGYNPRSYLGERYQESIRWTALLEQQGRQVFERTFESNSSL